MIMSIMSFYESESYTKIKMLVDVTTFITGQNFHHLGGDFWIKILQMIIKFPHEHLITALFYGFWIKIKIFSLYHNVFTWWSNWWDFAVIF